MIEVPTSEIPLNPAMTVAKICFPLKERGQDTQESPILGARRRGKNDGHGKPHDLSAYYKGEDTIVLKKFCEK